MNQDIDEVMNSDIARAFLPHNKFKGITLLVAPLEYRMAAKLMASTMAVVNLVRLRMKPFKHSYGILNCQ